MILQELADLIDIALNGIDKKISEIKMCELGDQRMKWNEYLTGKNSLLIVAL